MNKKLLAAAAIAIASITTTVPAQAEGFSLIDKLRDLDSGLVKGKNMFRKAIPSQVFAVEADGANLRMYVFEHPGSNEICTFVAGENKGGLYCRKVGQ